MQRQAGRAPLLRRVRGRGVLVSSGDLNRRVVGQQKQEIDDLSHRVRSPASKNKATLALAGGFGLLILAGILMS